MIRKPGQSGGGFGGALRFANLKGPSKAGLEMAVNHFAEGTLQ